MLHPAKTPTRRTLVHSFPDLIPGKLLSRYKRFFADIELDTGETVTAHCPNTGPMTGVCKIGSPVLLSLSTSPTRKLPYTWELIQVTDNNQTLWTGVNTALPNRVIRHALENYLIPELTGYDRVRHEVPYGQESSRIDFLLTSDAYPPTYVEVKNTTWIDGSLALFPDTVTERGQKHLREMTALRPYARAIMLYFINRGDADRFAPGDSRDPQYGQLLRTAMTAGVEVMPCRFDVTPEGLYYVGLAKLDF
jgi:sugar fermentation stimulation protein A